MHLWRPAAEMLFLLLHTRLTWENKCRGAFCKRSSHACQWAQLTGVLGPSPFKDDCFLNPRSHRCCQRAVLFVAVPEPIETCWLNQEERCSGVAACLVHLQPEGGTQWGAWMHGWVCIFTKLLRERYSHNMRTLSFRVARKHLLFPDQNLAPFLGGKIAAASPRTASCWFTSPPT